MVAVFTVAVVGDQAVVSHYHCYCCRCCCRFFVAIADDVDVTVVVVVASVAVAADLIPIVGAAVIFVALQQAEVAAHDLKNFIYLLDEWFSWKERSTARPQPCEIHLHPHTNVDIADVWDNLQYAHYTMYLGVSSLVVIGGEVGG